MPTVSVVIPNYNHARYLAQRIESVLRQSYQDFEVILLDDASTDDSRAVLSQYASDPRVRLEFNEVNSGTPFKQWNKGVSLARGKYVWIAESDDYADQKLLEALVAVLDRETAVAFAYCRSWHVTADDEIKGYGDWYLDNVDPRLWKSDFCLDGREFCRKYLTQSPVVCNASAVLFRKGAYEKAGGADESLRLCGDWKVWAALALVGDVAFISQPLNYFRYHATSVRGATVRSATDIMEKLQVIRWILDRAAPSRSDLRNACKEASGLWVPAILSFRFPLQVKREILMSAKEIDPHLLRRVARPALSTLRLKFARHCRGLWSILGGARQLRQT
jgi:glycosyltransferase involved in cell wall biosynthesis